MTRQNMKKAPLAISDERKLLAEQEIVLYARVVDYDTKEYPVEVIVAKYLKDKSEDNNEIFIPDYQREFVWDARRQSKFIESILIGLPIPFFFVADVPEKDGRLEIVDGSQRIRTLAAFLNDELQLIELKKLTQLNGFKFSDLSIARQRRFRGKSLRTIALTDKADEEIRRDLFERINTGSDVLKNMERRRGIKPGPFLDFIQDCAKIPLFRKLTPLSDFAVKRLEYDEFVLRFFAYLENYKKFDRSVVDFLDSYLKKMESSFPTDRAREMRAEFEAMLVFVENNFPQGFAKKTGHVRTPRIRFEAISVGTALALRIDPDLIVGPIKWITSDEFKDLVTSDASNSRPKVIKRIEYVMNQLLSAATKPAELPEVQQ